MSNARERAETLLAETREELTRVDQKATILLSVNGILVSALLAASLAGGFKPEQLDNVVEWAFWVGAGALIAAEGLLCAAVIPYVGHRGGSMPPRYFAQVAKLTREQLKESLAVDEDPGERALDELHALAPVALRKYRLIIAGQVALAGGVILCGTAGLVG